MTELPSDKYPVLYHYTNYEGLKGVLGSQQLFATHYLCMNESYARKLVTRNQAAFWICDFVQDVRFGGVG